MPVPVWSVIVALPAVLALCWVVSTATQLLDDQGRPTYEMAGFVFPEHAKFDNSWLTWSSDYVISVVMLIQAIGVLRVKSLHSQLRKLVVLLLILYGVSTFLGGMAHQLYSGDIKELNSLVFYVVWVGVVGCTVVAGGVQGAIGDELLSIHGMKKTFSPHVWMTWCAMLLVIVALGGFSCVRPACDIFLAGITQSIPVFYLQYSLFVTCFSCKTLPPWNFWILFVGCILNAPLIVLYPHLLEFYGPSLTNLLLHMNLLISWGSQGFGYIRAVESLSIIKTEKGS